MFQFNYKLYSQVALLLLGVSPLIWNANPASAVTGTETIDNTSFTISPSIGTNAAPHNSTIDNTALSTLFNGTGNGGGFNNKFTSTTGDTFLLLGASNPSATINGGSNATQNATNVDAKYSSFTVDTDDITDGLNFSFDWAFRGNTPTGRDSFTIGFVPTGGNASSLNYTELVFQNTYADNTFNGTADLTGLSTGSYDLIISLTEATTAGNSAVGFDNFIITDVPSAAVPFEFSPTLGLLVVGGFFGGVSYLKRRKAAANIELK